MIPWSRLARGRLARGAASSEATARSQTDRFGKTLYDATAAADARMIERVDAVAKARGVPNAQVALAWLLRQKGVAAPIIGATRMTHLDDAVAAVSLKLSDEEARTLEEPYLPHAVAGFS
jgi:aryl-alcohol dehydrogenase-like predicted oxidoreductase